MAQELLLIDVPVGTQTTITTTNADAALDRRLHELGLRHGAEVTVVQKTAGGGRVVRTHSTRYALDAQALRSIHVQHTEAAL